MLAMRMEELQIGWACSAQNPEMLPTSIKRKSTGGQSIKQHAGKYFNGST